MPPELIERAKDVLKQLEAKHLDSGIAENVKNLTAPKVQLSIFDEHSQAFEEMRKMLDGLDLNRLTPIEALMKLNEIKNLLK